ncbi:MAG: hypothetical protein OXU34_01775 [Gammaproteobacteria bacterium]|nr:hypothetical protein [Gammaproteobacteria bacterium]
MTTLTRRFFRRAAVAVLAAALAVSAAPAAERGAARVAVVSLLGDVFPSIYLGSTAMSKKRHRTRVAPWRLDDHVRDVVTAVIRREGRLRPVDFRPDRKAWMQVYTDEFRLFDDSNYDLKKIRGAVRALRSRHGADTLILVLADRVTDPIEESSTELGGYGLYRHDFILDRSYLYAFFRVLAVDTRTLEIKAQARVAAHTTVERKFWSAGLNKLPPPARRALRAMTRQLLAANTAQALADAGLAARASVAPPPEEDDGDAIEVELVGVEFMPPGGDRAGRQPSYADNGARRRDDSDTRRHGADDARRHADNDAQRHGNNGAQRHADSNAAADSNRHTRSTAGGDYEAAARQLFIALDMEAAFNRYALDYVQNRVLGGAGHPDLYRDVCRRWVAEHFRWPALKNRVVALYRRQGLSARDLAELADFGASAAGGKALGGGGAFSGAGQRQIWRQVASAKRLKALRRAVSARKRLILREAENLAR